MMSIDRKTVLVVDDEAPIRRFLRPFLDAQGYAVLEAVNGREALALISTRQPDVVLLDLGLPDMDGKQILAALPPWSRAAVIVVSARGQEEEKVQALDEGAVDYLVKPFGLAELAARIRAVLRRRETDPAAASAPGDHVDLGELHIDVAAHVVRKRGEEIHLTPMEFKLLTYLVRHLGKVVTQQQLLREVWGVRNPEQEHYVRIHVHKLRQKIEDDPARPRHLRTETGVGYRLVE